MRIPIFILFEIDYTLFIDDSQFYFEKNRIRITKKDRFHDLICHFTNHYKQTNHLKDMPIDDNPIARLMLRSVSFWNSVRVLLNSLTPELSEIPLERLSTART